MTDERQAGLREALETAKAACGSFLWLGNNLHNRDSTTFHELLDAAFEDAQRGYDAATAALAAQVPAQEERPWATFAASHDETYDDDVPAQEKRWYVVEYDAENHALIATERLGENDYGAASIIGHGVPPEWGHRIAALLSGVPAQEERLDVERLMDAAGAIGYALERLPKSGSKMTQAAEGRIADALVLFDEVIRALGVETKEEGAG